MDMTLNPSVNVTVNKQPIRFEYDMTKERSEKLIEEIEFRLHWEVGKAQSLDKSVASHMKLWTYIGWKGIRFTVGARPSIRLARNYLYIFSDNYR